MTLESALSRVAAMLGVALDWMALEEFLPPYADPQLRKSVLASSFERIHRANLNATFPGGLTLTDALNRRDVLDLRLKALRSAADTASQRQTRCSNSEVRILSVIPARDFQKQVDALAMARRELETDIQQANWFTELSS